MALHFASIVAICNASEPTSKPSSRPALQKNEVLRVVLGAVQDGTKLIDEVGLYLLLERSGSPPASDRMPEVTWASLVERPDEFRGEWVRVACRFAEARRGQLDNSQLWPGPIFTVIGIDETDGEPVSMVATVGPAFRRNAPIWLEGQFFKIRVDVPRDQAGGNETKQLLIPVLVGRQVRGRNAWITLPSTSGRDAMRWTVTVVVVLLVVWLIVRQRSATRRRQCRALPRSDAEDLGYGQDAFEPIDLEKLERDVDRENSEDSRSHERPSE